jgi:glycosyltransferase involved in cell wall biosynthesis
VIFIVYAESKRTTIRSAMGQADYSYYFVLQQFKPMLERFGQVIEVVSVDPYVDLAYYAARATGERCVFLSFTPPHKTNSELGCPTIPVFAWEYSTIPSEAWAGDTKNNWAAELTKYPLALTHSSQTCRAVKEAISEDYPIFSIPAPLWDQYSKNYCEDATSYFESPVEVRINGWVVDSADFDVSIRRHEEKPHDQLVSLSGVIYCSVFNPNDGRKNWQDMLHAFCWAFRQVPDATLVFKLTHSDPQFSFEVVASEIRKMLPFQCRVVLLQGFLLDDEYEKLIQATHFVTNSSYGEGQCLPLMEFMSAGKPAVAPDHSGMADYINAENSFVVTSSDDWTHWPHDLRVGLRTFRRLISWESLHNCYLESYDEAKNRPDAYRRRAAQAHSDLKHHCSHGVARYSMTKVLEILGFSEVKLTARWPRLVTWFLQKIIFWRMETSLKYMAIAEFRIKGAAHYLVVKSKALRTKLARKS